MAGSFTASMMASLGSDTPWAAAAAAAAAAACFRGSGAGCHAGGPCGGLGDQAVGEHSNSSTGKH